MKKKIALLFMLIISIFTLASCSLILGSLTGYGANMSYNYSENSEAKLRENMDLVKELVLQNDNYKKFESTFRNVSIDTYKVSTYYNLAYIDYCKTGSTDALESSKRFRLILTDIIKWRDEIFPLIYESNYSDEFFKDLTEEEIDELVNNQKPDEYYTLDNANQDLIIEFNNKENITDEELKSIYQKMVDNNNKITKLLEYDTYMDYASDSVYGRSYDTDEIVNFTNYVKEYIVPLYLKLAKQYIDISNTAKNDNPESYDAFRSFETAKYTNYSEIINKYVNAMDKNFANQYRSAMRSSYVNFGNSEKSYDGAFTTYLLGYQSPAMYFGPRYQNATTILHEFGHFYSAIKNNGTTEDLDLAETQSQGDEMLFLAYANNVDYFPQAVEDLIMIYEMQAIMHTIIECSMICEFEIYCHNAKDFSVLNLDEIYKEICEAYGGFDELTKYFGYNPNLYWKKVVVPHSGYYISYAVSAVPAVMLYCKSMTDFASCCDSYIKLLESSDQDFTTALKNCNMYTPFEKDTYTIINSAF